MMKLQVWILLVLSIGSIVLERSNASALVAEETDYVRELGLASSSVQSLAQPAYITNVDNSDQSVDEVSNTPKHDRKSQLPVTTSHLKRPAFGSHDEQEEPGESVSFTSNVSNVESVLQKTGGAKSLVSPTVLVDEPAPNQNPSKKKLFINPDVLEISQIMNGVTNASSVPAVVNREYGHHTRTRITIGGGYVRDRLPPLVNPTLVNERLEKPYVPLENPKVIIKNELPERVINAPDKISLPAEEYVTQVEMNQKYGENNNNNNKNNNKQSQRNSTSGAGKLDTRCPKRGITTYDHPTACDKYFYCEDGYIHELVCPNGLMYGVKDLIVDYCVHRWNADCQERTIPNPISSPGCRWQYGIFNVQGSPKCSPDFYECSAGKFEVKKCLIDGQVYDDRTKSCLFAEQVGCANEVLADFHCPPDDQSNTYWPFPRYFLNERALIHCVNDKPEIVRCTENERVDPEHLHCIPIAKVYILKKTEGYSVLVSC